MAASETGASARNPDEFVITRTFDAPRDLVFRAWTEREHLMRWWGPKGFTMRAGKIDLRPGGVFHYGMRAPDGSDMWGRWIFREVVKPERLVFIASFSDEQGGEARHPMAPDWPLETLSTITFADEGGRTTVTIRWTPHKATDAERKTFAAGRDSMQKGWTGTLDQFADYLAKAER